MERYSLQMRQEGAIPSPLTTGIDLLINFSEASAGLCAVQEVDDDSGWLGTLDNFKHICDESPMSHSVHAHVTHIFDV